MDLDPEGEISSRNPGQGSCWETFAREVTLSGNISSKVMFNSEDGLPVERILHHSSIAYFT